MMSSPIQPGRPGFLRSMNQRAALTALIAQGPMTRNQIGDVTGLSGPTTSQLVERLTGDGLICEAGHTAGSRGPNAIIYRARTELARGVALDVRSNQIAAQVVDAAGQAFPVAEIRLPRQRHSAGADLKAAIDAAATAAGQDPAQLIAMCAGVPGAVSEATDSLHFTDSLPGWPHRGVRAQLEAELGLTVIIENDANLSATAEAEAFGDDRDFVLLWQGEGLGVASVSDGRVHKGAAGGAGEIGYLPAPRTAVQIDPSVTDLQSLAGAMGVSRVVRVHYPHARTYGLAVAHLRDDPLRAQLLAELAPRTAEALIPVIAVLDPATVVLGGPTGAACGPQGARMVQSYIRRHTRWRTPVVATAVPDQPVLRGAALSLSRHLADHLLARIT